MLIPQVRDLILSGGVFGSLYAVAVRTPLEELKGYTQGFDAALSRTSSDERTMRNIRERDIQYQVYNCELQLRIEGRALCSSPEY